MINTVRGQKLSKKEVLSFKYGNLELLDQNLPDYLVKYAKIKVLAKCSCGNIKEIFWPDLARGHTKSCGECTFKSKEHWLNQKYNNLKLLDRNLPSTFGPRSDIQVYVECICKSVTLKRWAMVASGKTSLCGQCNAISKEEASKKIFGKLSIIDSNLPLLLFPYSEMKVLTKCSCGNETEKIWSNLYQGDTSSCGDCNRKDKKYWLKQKFGKLTLLNKDFPESCTPCMDVHVWTKCECSFESLKWWPDLSQGRINACGFCNRKRKEELLSEKYGKLVLLDKNLPNIINSPWVAKKYWFKCDCGRETEIALRSVVSGNTQSCGLCYREDQSSRLADSVYKFVSNLVPQALKGVRTLIPRHEIDIYIPDSKLAIEVNGCYWHSSKALKEGQLLRDYEKFKKLRDMGIRVINIFEDEWVKKLPIFEEYLKDVLGCSKKKRISISFQLITKKEASAFLDKFHYLSGNRHSGSYYVGAVSKDIIYGVWVFKKRSSKNVEITRACFHPNFKTWNPHKRMLDFIVPILLKDGFDTVVSFSDNRLHTGNLYKNLGFTLAKELLPDYYYVKSMNRKHKFNFRVKAGIDEEVEAQKKGFYRIYDCGKTKWQLDIINKEI